MADGDADGDGYVKQRRAFTLVELMLVIAMTAIVAGMAAGGLKSVRSAQKSNAVRRVQADLTYARDRAMSTGCRTQWALVKAAQAYELRAESAPASGTISAKVIKLPSGAAWHVALRDLAAGLSVSKLTAANSNAVFFAAAGNLINKSGKPAGDATVKFNSGAIIAISSTTGAAAVHWP